MHGLCTCMVPGAKGHMVTQAIAQLSTDDSASLSGTFDVQFQLYSSHLGNDAHMVIPQVVSDRRLLLMKPRSIPSAAPCSASQESHLRSQAWQLASPPLSRAACTVQRRAVSQASLAGRQRPSGQPLEPPSTRGYLCTVLNAATHQWCAMTTWRVSEELLCQ